MKITTVNIPQDFALFAILAVRFSFILDRVCIKSTHTFHTSGTVTVTPVQGATDLLGDTQKIGKGVVVGPGNWQQMLEDNKQGLVAKFVQRSRFTTALATVDDGCSICRRS